MFFWFSKVFEFVFSPLTWIIVFLLLAFFMKNPKRKRRFFVVGFILIFVFTNNFLATEAMRLWEVKQHSMDKDEYYDVAVVLGGGMMTSDAANNTVAFRKNTDRMMQGLLLYHQGKVNKIIISGGSASMVYPDMHEACLLKDYLTEIGYNPDDFWAECRSVNTYENAEFVSQIIKDSLPEANVLLITSAYHMRRAKACFKKTGLEVDVYPTNHIAGARRFDLHFLLIPSSSALQTWEILIKEISGYCIYKIKGYL